MDSKTQQHNGNENSSKETFSTLTKDFCGYTSAHGLERIMDSTSWPRKLFWSLLFVAAVAVLSLQFRSLFLKYQSRPLVTLVTLESDTSLPFPAVTFCNFNALRYGKLLESNFSDLIETLKRQNKSSLSADNSSSSPTDDLSSSPTDDSSSSPTDDSSSSTTEDSSSSPTDDSSSSPTEYSTTAERSWNTDDYPTTANSSDDDLLSNYYDKDYFDFDFWDNDFDYEDPEYLDPDVLASEKIQILLAQKDEGLLSPLGHQFEDMVLSCTFRGIPCSNFTDRFWTKFWHHKYGNCYVFNSGVGNSGLNKTVMKSNKAGPTHGLNLELNIEQDQYLDQFTPEAGVRVTITNQGEMPFPYESGLSIAPGFASMIGIRKMLIKREDPFENNRCHKASSADESNLYSKTFNAVYSSTACKESCLAFNQRKNCGCMEYRFPVGNTSVCDITNKTTVGCLGNVYKMFQQNELNCSKSCPPPCREEEFKLSTSFAVWPSEYYEDFYETELQKRGKFVWRDENSYRSNVLKLHVFYEELNFEMIAEKRSYELPDFVSDIGGQLGLWIGFSVLTVVEFLEFMLLLIHLLFKKCCRGSQVESNSIELKNSHESPWVNPKSSLE